MYSSKWDGLDGWFPLHHPTPKELNVSFLYNTNSN